MPTKDEREWVGMNGCPILPPVYTRKVGRPPTKRRVAPEDKDGLLSRHGTIQHCSIFFFAGKLRVFIHDNQHHQHCQQDNW
jgi:hypothetical protein